jgi:hypothetical protein
MCHGEEGAGEWSFCSKQARGERKVKCNTSFFHLTGFQTIHELRNAILQIQVNRQVKNFVGGGVYIKIHISLYYHVRCLSFSIAHRRAIVTF